MLNVFVFSIKVPENGVPPEWYSYFLCGVKGIHDELQSNDLPCGMFAMVSGTIPPASGLSSSSALVSAAALATSYTNDVCSLLFFCVQLSALNWLMLLLFYTVFAE